MIHSDEELPYQVKYDKINQQYILLNSFNDIIGYFIDTKTDANNYTEQLLFFKRIIMSIDLLKDIKLESLEAAYSGLSSLEEEIIKSRRTRKKNKNAT